VTSTTGTCQICERTLKVNRGKISLHGYNRPGHGYIQGRCPGSGQPPWEVSSDALRRFVDDVLERRLAHVRENLAYITNPDLKEITEVKVSRGQPGEVKIWKRGERDDRGYDMFGILTEGRKRQYESEIRLLEREIARHRDRLAAWRPKSQTK
jgi:hypothetical protein